MNRHRRGSMIVIRKYKIADAAEVGLLIKNTYSQFNLNYLPIKECPPFLGPFQHADNPTPEQLQAIQGMIWSEVVLVAERDGKIVGVLRGRINRLGSLFVGSDYHQQGIGRSLVERFEDWVAERGRGVIKVASSLYAVPFYMKMGYKKSTGVRKSWSFEGYGFPIQPMRKIISKK
jgi:GNAT superfamily N-acetyltransferase